MSQPDGPTVVLFNRDLRVHDHPALAAATERSELVVPLFVIDDTIMGSDFASPNRVGFLVECLRDLRRALQDRGASLVVRTGDPVTEAMRIVDAVGASAVFVTADVGRFAQDRERRLAAACDGARIELQRFPGVTVVPPGELCATGGGHYRVFTPYWRVWQGHRWRPLAPTRRKIRMPRDLDEGPIPNWDRLVSGDRSPGVMRGGETEGRDRLHRWLRSSLEGYGDGHDALAADETSRLSPYLHFGCLSSLEVAIKALDREGAEPFVRQVCWRDFHHQVTAEHPRIATVEYRSRNDRWRDDAQELAAWQEGRTGYPIVDAGMRQLAAEGWMHNRARLITASFLTKDLYLDWRVGARWFLGRLIDGDIANNSANWQWVAGTGNDTRPNRVLNPLLQADRYDPDGDYVRRWVPELAHIGGNAIHRPWELRGSLFGEVDYPERLVDHQEAVAAFREHRR